MSPGPLAKETPARGSSWTFLLGKCGNFSCSPCPHQVSEAAGGCHLCRWFVSIYQHWIHGHPTRSQQGFWRCSAAGSPAAMAHACQRPMVEGRGWTCSAASGWEGPKCLCPQHTSPPALTRGFLGLQKASCWAWGEHCCEVPGLHGKGCYIDAWEGVWDPRHRDSVNALATAKRSN